ncbi:MAG: 6-bladed beta-propeller [Balneolaceae bacterium]
MDHIKILIFLSISFSGCLPANEIEIPEHIAQLENLTVYDIKDTAPLDMHLEAEVIFGGSTEAFIGSISGIAVDQAGRVFLGDGGQRTVYIFNPDGSYLTNLGRPGEGPGEFRSMDSNLKVNSEYLFVYDPARRRINVFSLEELTPFHTINLSWEEWSAFEELKGAAPVEFFPKEDNSLVLSFIRSRQANQINEQVSMFDRDRLYYLLDDQGKIISDKLFEVEDSRNFSFQMPGWSVSFSYPFFGHALTGLTGHHLLLADPKDFLVKVYDVEGNYLRAFYYPFKKKELTREEAIRYSQDEVLQNVARNIQLPESWPVLNDLVVDDEDRIWVSTIIDNEDEYKWWVLDEDGSLLARFHWPVDKLIVVVKGGYVYTRETDLETDLQKVVKYRIEWSKDGW